MATVITVKAGKSAVGWLFGRYRALRHNGDSLGQTDRGVGCYAANVKQHPLSRLLVHRIVPCLRCYGHNIATNDHN